MLVLSLIPFPIIDGVEVAYWLDCFAPPSMYRQYGRVLTVSVQVGSRFEYLKPNPGDDWYSCGPSLRELEAVR